MTRNRSPRRLALIFAVTAALTLACTGGSTESDSTTTPIATRVAGSDENALVGILRWIPAQDEAPEDLTLTNIRALRESAGVAPPGADPPDFDEVQTYVQRLSDGVGAGASEFSILGAGSANEEHYDNLLTYLHLTLADVDVIAEVSLAAPADPPSGRFDLDYEITVGSFDSVSAAASLIECDGCAVETREQDHRGRTYYESGEGFDIARRLAPPLFDAIGRPVRLFLTDEVIVRSSDSGPIELALDARYADDTPSLADVEDFVLAAAALDREGSWSAMLTRDTQGPAFWDEFGSLFDESDAIGQRRQESWTAQSVPLLRPYRLLANGVASEGTRSSLIVVLVHETAEDAQANIERIERRIDETESVVTGTPWRDRITDRRIESDGRVLTVELAGLPLYWLYYLNGDPLFLHE